MQPRQHFQLTGLHFAMKTRRNNMKGNTRIYNRWQGYSVADCACEWCLYYDGKCGCALESCCCQKERDEAQLREREAAAQKKVS
jgi:hypothetical protein